MPKKILLLLVTSAVLALGSLLWSITKKQQNQNPEDRALNEQAENHDNYQSSAQTEAAGKDASLEQLKTTAEIDTRTWKTYREEDGFEVRYPDDWEYNLIDCLTFVQKKCIKNKFNECRDYISFCKYIGIGNYYKSVFEWRGHDLVNCNVKNTNDVISYELGVNTPTIKFDNATVDVGNYSSYYFIDKNRNGWEITIKYYNNEKDADKIVLLKKIASTFKLL